MGHRVREITNYAKGTGLFMSASAVMLVLNLLANPLLAINMSPNDYAITGYYTSFNGLISPLIMFYLVGYYAKEYYKVDPAGREFLYALAFKGLIYISALISLVCFTVLTVYLVAIKSSSELPIFPYLALSVFSLPLSGIYALKISRMKIEKQFKRGFVYSVTTGIVGLAITLLFVAVFKWGAFGKLLAPFVCNLGVFAWLIYNSRSVMSVKVGISAYPQVFRFCFPLVLGAMLEYFSKGFTTTYLEGLGDLTTYGIYVVGASIGAYVAVFSSSISSVIQPDVYEATINRKWRRLILLSLGEVGVVGAIVLCFTVLAPYVIHILTAGRYDSSTVFAQITSISALSTTVFYRLNDFAIITNHQHFYFIATIIGSLLIVIALHYAVKHAGYIGGCWVQAFSNLLFGAIMALLLICTKNRSHDTGRS